MTGETKRDKILGSLFGKKKGEGSEGGKKQSDTTPPPPVSGTADADLDALIRKIGLGTPREEKGDVPLPVAEGQGYPAAGTSTPAGPPITIHSEKAGEQGDIPAGIPPDQPPEASEKGRGEAPVTAPPKFVPAKRKVRGADKGAEDEAVISVDEIDDLSGLILPKGATFQIEEVRIQDRSNIFTFKGMGGDVVGKDLQKSDLVDSGIKRVTEVAGEVQAEDSSGSLLKKFNPLRVIHKVPVEYNPRTHGPLVDLTFRPRPGVEQIELYPVNEPYAYVRITYDNATHEYLYEVLEPKLTPAENDLFKDIKERIFERLDLNTQNVLEDIAKKTLRDVTDDIIRDYGISLSPIQREKILYAMYKEFLGNGMIDPLMHDRYIEDISCDGVNANLFVFHTRYESMRTNLVYRSADELDSFVIKLAQRSGKYISIAEPMLDATMSDGSRIQMTLGTEVTAHGSTYTIRKFKDEPITPTDLIEWRTFSPLSIAFFWLAVESGKSCIFAGGTASGKTTSLNAISLFIPPLAKIVTLEDTRELKLPHPNWIPSITRTSFDTSGKGEIDMYELLRAALRQRPEYILVGEVRGKEALTLFQAMSTGHVTYSTIHADSVASIVHRLENPPLNVPRNMLSALDLVSVQVQARVGGQRIRRNKQIIEILDIDPRTNELITNEVFRWHPATDEITYSGKSYVLEEIMESRGWDEERMREELKMRQEVLEWMRIKKIRNYRDVSNILIQYYRDPAGTMEKVRKELYGYT
ncbi:MAG: ATPase, T2SS/T4P/T4SS family [Methanolinea sp.]|nr:ATPase, T2SS/T4P/T4SS family [Methanolinea sp.]